MFKRKDYNKPNMLSKLISSINLIVVFLIINTTTKAQPFTLKSVGETKPFQLQIHYGTKGKGAFVQYVGQKGIIPLRIKTHAVDSTERESGQPDFTTYVWDEVIDGKVTGSYGLVEELRHISDPWYVRKKDGKRFRLEYVNEKKLTYDGNKKFLLHGALLSFNIFKHHQLSITYPDGQKKTIQLPDFDHPDYVRQSIIADYNFDGYDDIAFSIPDAGMGVYRTFSIWLYQPTSKRFEKLVEPDYSRSNCSGLCDVTLDGKRKLFFTACRGGARWWQDVYQFDKRNKLVWIKSVALNQ